MSRDSAARMPLAAALHQVSTRACRQAVDARRARGIKAIKAAARQLGLDDATYRDLLAAQTRTATSPGKRSATELTLVEQAKVLDHMRRAGAKHPADGRLRRRAEPAAHRAELMAKVRALLAELSRITGEPHSLHYADAICKRNGWCEVVDFADGPTLHRLVGALSRTLRAKAKAAGTPTPY